jgi:osmotically-inducible protein OsmY
MSTNNTSIAALHRIRLGSRVVATDGDFGAVAQILVLPAERRVARIGVRRGVLGGRSYGVPLDLVETATGNALSVQLTRKELTTKVLPPLDEAIALTRDTGIMHDGHTLFTATQLFIQPDTGVITHVIARRTQRPWGEIVLPASLIGAFGVRHLVLGCQPEDLVGLPEYRPDEAVAEDVRRALWAVPRLRIDMRGIEVRVRDGVLELAGNVSSALNEHLAIEQATSVTGVLEVLDHLVADTNLAVAVAEALAHDPRLHRMPIGVYADLGAVTLRGAVHTPEAREAAEALAQAVPGVRSLQNAILVNPRAELLPIMAGVTGDEDRVP